MRRIYKVGAVILKNKKLLLVKKRSGDILISPGGKPENDETPEETLRRELREELNVELIGMKHLDIFKDKAVYEKNTQLVMDVYIAKIKGNLKPSSEIEDAIWISKDYKKNGIKVAPILERFIIPRLIEMNLL